MLAARATIFPGLVASDELMTCLYLSLGGRVFLFCGGGSNAVPARLLCRIERRVSGGYNFITRNALRWIIRNTATDADRTGHAGKMMRLDLPSQLLRHPHGVFTGGLRHHNGKFLAAIAAQQI